MNKVKEEDKILITLALFSISVGLWGNFRQLVHGLYLFQHHMKTFAMQYI